MIHDLLSAVRPGLSTNTISDQVNMAVGLGVKAVMLEDPDYLSEESDFYGTFQICAVTINKANKIR